MSLKPSTISFIAALCFFALCAASGCAEWAGFSGAGAFATISGFVAVGFFVLAIGEAETGR